MSCCEAERVILGEEAPPRRRSIGEFMRPMGVVVASALMAKQRTSIEMAAIASAPCPKADDAELRDVLAMLISSRAASEAGRTDSEPTRLGHAEKSRGAHWSQAVVSCATQSIFGIFCSFQSCKFVLHYDPLSSPHTGHEPNQQNTHPNWCGRVAMIRGMGIGLVQKSNRKWQAGRISTARGVLGRRMA